jgi:hypothetical protein
MIIHENFRGRIIVPALLFLVLAPFILHAHKLHHPKVVIIEINKKNIKVMMNYIANPGDQSRHLRMRFDADKNGKLSGEEKDELQKFLIKNMLSTFNLYLNGNKPDFEPLDYRVENIDADVDSSSSVGIDIHLLSKNIVYRKVNDIVVSDFILEQNVHVPLIVKFAPGFEIISSNMGKIVKKSNIIRDIDLERGKELIVRFREI